MRIDLFAEDACGSDNVKQVVASILGGTDSETPAWTGEGMRTYRSTRRKPGPRKFGSGPRQLKNWGTRPALKVALNAWFGRSPDAVAVIVATDVDRKDERKLTREEREELLAMSPPLIVAEMNPEAEAWRIVTFSPRTPNETRCLADIRRDLSFNPCVEPERMHSTSGQSAERDCKTVATRLFEGDPTAGLCHLDTHIDKLKKAPATSGLPQFVLDVDSYLAR